MKKCVIIFLILAIFHLTGENQCQAATLKKSAKIKDNNRYLPSMVFGNRTTQNKQVSGENLRLPKLPDLPKPVFYYSFITSTKCTAKVAGECREAEK